MAHPRCVPCACNRWQCVRPRKSCSSMTDAMIFKRIDVQPLVCAALALGNVSPTATCCEAGGAGQEDLHRVD